METILDIVKNHVSVPEGAAYCLGMMDGYPTEISCPCHGDEDASMQLYDNHYHCPVCGTTGDVTDLVAKKMHCRDLVSPIHQFSDEALNHFSVDFIHVLDFFFSIQEILDILVVVKITIRREVFQLAMPHEVAECT